MAKIIIVVDKEGNIKRDFIGFEGKECFQEAKEMDSELYDAGIKVKDWKIKKKTGKQLNEQVIKV